MIKTKQNKKTVRVHCILPPHWWNPTANLKSENLYLEGTVKSSNTTLPHPHTVTGGGISSTALPDGLPACIWTFHWRGTSYFIKQQCHCCTVLIVRVFFSNFQPLVFKPTHVTLTNILILQRLDNGYQIDLTMLWGKLWPCAWASCLLHERWGGLHFQPCPGQAPQSSAWTAAPHPRWADCQERDWVLIGSLQS